MYKAANALSKPLRPKQHILAAEVLVQIHRCRQALREKRWHAAIAAAQLLGEARGALFHVTSQYNARAEGAPAGAATKNLKMARVMKEAARIYREMSLDAQSPIKVENLWAEVRKSLTEKKRWCCKFKAFADHWSRHKMAKN